MASCHTWTCKKMKNAIFFGPILLHIWCCYKTYTIKGLLLCPWCVVTVANLHQTELAIMQRTIFFCREKQQKGKKLWTNCVFIGPICAKRNSLGAILHESNQSLDAMLLHLKARSRLGTQSSSTLVLIVLKKDTLPHYLFWIMHPTVPSWVCYPKEMMCRSSFWRPYIIKETL